MKGLGLHPGPLRRSVVGLVVLVAVALLAGVGSGAGSGRVSVAQDADSIPPGFDLFETDPEHTVFSFRDQTAIPADFFAPGSERFEGDVPFGGVPIGKFRSRDVGDADTVVQRKSSALVPSSGSPSQPVDIELRRLSLVSVEPIKVKVGGVTQRWEVRARVSASRPSTGQMAIARTQGTRFGTFDSRLVVYPRFTFTRVTKAGVRPSQAPKVIDVGALPDGIRPDDASLTFAADGVPWREGCVEPALEVPGLNEEFCPGLAEGGNPTNPPFPGGPTDADKKLTEHQSTYANHGIWPVQPRLEHFACYSVADQGPVFTAPPRELQLADQFGRLAIKVSAPAEFCNPARKKAESFKNKDAHLRCYSLDGQTAGRVAALHNQFGVFRLQVRKARRLCLPSTKQVVGGSPPPADVFVTDHFQCYGVKALGSSYKKRDVRFTDQFQTFVVRIFKPSRLCAPVAKNKVSVQHAVGHLVCYSVAGPVANRDVIVRNQFTQRSDPPKPEELVTGRVRQVCIPSLKLLLP